MARPPYQYAPEKSGPHEFVVPNGNSVILQANEFGQVTVSIEFMEFLLVRLLGWRKTTPLVNIALDSDNFH